MTDLVLWLITHGPTVQAIILTFLIAFVTGAAYQFCEDDKKATSHANVK